MKALFNDIYNKILDWFQVERSENTSDTAANRLQVILMHDRTKLDPLIMSKMREEYTNFDKTEYNRLKDQIYDRCRFITSQNSYSDPCLKRCLSLSKDIAAIEGKAADTSACGFSQKVLIWVENILRLVKYIIPVVLIILSILDFMRALAAEKEDEMKKAQKHFVIRLIAAVLIFLMPTILSFVMEKMGFSAESCGIKGLGF